MGLSNAKCIGMFALEDPSPLLCQGAYMGRDVESSGKERCPGSERAKNKQPPFLCIFQKDTVGLYARVFQKAGKKKSPDEAISPANVITLLSVVAFEQMEFSFLPGFQKPPLMNLFGSASC